MSVVVAYAWAELPQDATVRSDGTVDWTAAKPALTPGDAAAIARGREAADALGTECIGLCAGGPSAGTPSATKAALARGVDRAVVVADAALTFAGATRLGMVLAAAIDRLGDVDLVLTGEGPGVSDAATAAAVLAGRLGWPLLSGVTSVTADASGTTVERIGDRRAQRLRVAGPAVLAVSDQAGQPAPPGMADVLAAATKPVGRLELSALRVPEVAPGTVTATAKAEPAARRGQVIDGADAAEAASRLLVALRGEGLLGEADR
ncbi:electron transfer flavoprotein subunit beta/FixA family protein [Nigerium massiliense]|uniref:electron transfer flavoprotein subunit beta/FixA family protein n=1 Tax=Nigerium massiliense TaxID=1522317 RepID=UPI00058CB720|nr:hypothetical protein [Nigerium massiliense]